MAVCEARMQGDSFVINLTGISIIQDNAANTLIAPSLNAATPRGSARAVQGSFTSPTANARYVLEFFANPSGDAEDEIYHGLTDDTAEFSNEVAVS